MKTGDGGWLFVFEARMNVPVSEFTGMASTRYRGGGTNSIGTGGNRGGPTQGEKNLGIDVGGEGGGNDERKKTSCPWVEIAALTQRLSESPARCGKKVVMEDRKGEGEKKFFVRLCGGLRGKKGGGKVKPVGKTHPISRTAL